ncbi:MAG: YaiO family outer membrane beta-barrel protein [Candidatus Omnitrophota bacterium]
MAKRSLPWKNGVLVFLLATLPAFSYAAQQSDVEKLVERLAPPRAVTEERAEEKDRWFLDAFYEPSNILQGTRTGHWNEAIQTFGYQHKNITGYAAFSQLERFDIKDNTVNLGTYLTFHDQYAHIEMGYGWDCNFIYQWQVITEYGHKIYKDLYAQISYTYRAYRTDDTYLVAPGLIYYFGDSFMSANYGASYMESHDTANLGVFKGDFAITKFLRWNCGVAVGGRLYDIYGMDAADEFGYILFTGVNINVYKGWNCRVGYSYGTEEPKFIKRSVNFAASVKF